MKKHSRNEFNFESATQKMQALSHFDQHVVTWQCSATVIEMLNSFASGKFSVYIKNMCTSYLCLHNASHFYHHFLIFI